MWVVGIETSGQEGSVALARDALIVAERRLATAGRRHAQTLIHEIREMLSAAEIQPRQVDAVAVSLGPGSFTGLRVGVVCAKTWAYATGCGVVGIETLAAFASQAPDDWKQTWVIADAQRGDYFAAEYVRDGSGAWSVREPLAIVAGERWLAVRSPGERIIGPAAVHLRTESTPATIVRDDWAVRPSAAAIAKLGRQRILAGKADNAWTLSPIYIRPSAAEEKRASANRSS